ncbi:calcium-binding protein [Rhizobium sp. Leaf453]|uniref:calcium-binding protein n=1 Tax=Rhizobium sp. Leaf453 TaxID=1736380 RepID=UPI000714BE66|nr:calcium-binding protein [Rhizobium sp. Leaf453]KQU09489.1 hypothetical protein ASG68_00270 [Rhizobium sp. Leaf453]
MAQNFVLTSGIDVFTGTDDADTFSGVGGGLDLLKGGGGNDLFTIDELQMGVLDGGSDTDTVFLTGDENRISTDLTFRNVEILDLQAPKLYATVSQLDAISTLQINAAGLERFDILLEGTMYHPNWYLDLSTRYTSSTQLRVFADDAVNVMGSLRGDLFYGSAFDDGLRGLGGNDRLIGNSGNDKLNGGLGDDYLNGGSGTDTVWFEYATSGVTVDLEAGFSSGEGNDTLVSIENIRGTSRNRSDTLLGSSGANSIYGDTGNDTLDGRGGNDILDGGPGADNMTGGDGDDIFYVSHVDDSVSELTGGGFDIVIARAINFTFTDYVLNPLAEIESLRTSSSTGTVQINLTGNAFSQSITGNAADNTLSDGGPGGADTLRGLLGNDIYRVYNSGDVIVEVAGQGRDRVASAVDYLLATGVSVEILTTNGGSGKSGIDLTGNELVQSITGNAGANILNGKGGSDTLTGLGGADAFVFSTALGSGNVDTITDFSVADDTIRLDNAIFTALSSTGTLASGYFRSNRTGLAEDSNDHVIYEQDTGKLYYDADGTGATAGILFARTTAGLSLTSADFLVI